MGTECCMPRCICCTQLQIECAHPERFMLLQDQAHTKGSCIGGRLGLGTTKSCRHVSQAAATRALAGVPALC